MYYIGIDIGSTASKVAVYDDKKNDFVELFMIPTGWSGVEASSQILKMLEEKNIKKEDFYVDFCAVKHYDNTARTKNNK